MKANCEECMNWYYDEEFEEYTCGVNMDEDEIARLLSNPDRDCPYFRFGDDYTIVHRQI